MSEIASRLSLVSHPIPIPAAMPVSLNRSAPLVGVLGLLALAPRAWTQAPSFELKEGDRVALLGDVLLERENTHGSLELAFRAQFPDRSFSVRNLAWAGDTPAGWSRASFDGREKGIERLKEHLALVKPTVVFLGYGMAASLQEMTDRANDPTLNPDPARYGSDPMTAARFKKQLGNLIDLIRSEPEVKGGVRFVLLSPIRHEDLRASRPGLPDPAKHNELLTQYCKAIEELARERGVSYVDLASLEKKDGSLTTNGIHLTESGYRSFADAVVRQLGLASRPLDSKIKPDDLNAAVFRKNDLFFHRFRPANSTYLFGFRKHEQGQNAKEMAEFEPLLAAADTEIEKILRGTVPEKQEKAPGELKKIVETGNAKPEPLPAPVFDLDPSLEISLWAEAPMLGKPTQMNWDAEGRLWVSCTPIYPQIQPGAHPDDKVVVIEDSDRDGKADKSTTFAADLLIPSGVAVDTVVKDGKARQNAAYVGASTEILRLEDRDGDGRADSRQVVLSGFGTEDTHHTVHTLRWGPDGLLYFDQSVYIHTHLETPWGMVRLNAGGVFAYDPTTEHVEVFSKGLWNPWGHAWDVSGQSFLTDGAGFNGLSWAFPGAVFNPSEGARKTMQSISPGNYPKFAGLEIIHSPLFPADWQGTAVTCDFRAHRVVRFAIDDQSLPDKGGKSGYVTRELTDVVRTPDLAFRPIDVRLGPDGALYLADWTNPVINHGEVDFRDPRRDHVHGRIWRVAPKGSKPLKWEKLMSLKEAEVAEESKSKRTKLGTSGASVSLWEVEQLGRLAYAQGAIKPAPLIEKWADSADRGARSRVQMMRALSRKPSLDSASKILALAQSPPAEDPYYEFAAWISMNDLAEVWAAALAEGAWKADTEEKQKQLAWGLGAIRPELATDALSKLVASNQVPFDGTGPWIELLGRAGDSSAIGQLFDAVVRGDLKGDVLVRALRALAAAGRDRGVRPVGELKDIAAFFSRPEGEVASAALRAAAPWQIRGFIPLYARQSRSEEGGVRDAALDALREAGAASGEGKAAAVAALTELCDDNQPPALRRRASASLAALDLKGGLSVLVDVLTDQTNENDAVEAWRGLLSSQGAADTLAETLPRNLAQPIANAGMKAARDIGKKGEKLTAFLAPIAGLSPTVATQQANWKNWVDIVKRDGDPARGEEVYRRVSLACVTCHAIGGAGGKVGPELGTLGASAPLDYIIESIMEPAAKVKEGYNAVTLTLKDGTVVAGILARETDQNFVIRIATGAEQNVPKANVTGRENIGSLMPANLTASIKDRERIDLFAFLAQLGKAGSYDASKANVARTWWLYAKSAAEAAGVGTLKGGDGVAAYTNVDGGLPKDRLNELAGLVQGDAIFAVSKFNVAAAGRIPFSLQGVSEAWIDGQPLPVASEPSPQVELTAGDHVMAIKLTTSALPGSLRAASEGVRFINE